MPTYTFRDVNTGEYEDVQMSINQHAGFVRDNPHLKQVLSAPGVLTRYHGTGGTNMKPDNGFREVLRQIKSDHKGSKIDTF